MKPDYQPETVKVISFPETKVAVLEHCGDPNSIENSIRKFIEWRKASQVFP